MPRGHSGIGSNRPLTHQNEAVLDQAAPAQNTWYPVLETTEMCRILTFTVAIETVNETLEVRITADGIPLISGGYVCTAGQNNVVLFALDRDNSAQLALGLNKSTNIYYSFLIEAKSLKAEVRKTTANGAGNLKGVVQYQTYP